MPLQDKRLSPAVLFSCCCNCSAVSCWNLVSDKNSLQRKQNEVFGGVLREFIGARPETVRAYWLRTKVSLNLDFYCENIVLRLKQKMLE